MLLSLFVIKPKSLCNLGLTKKGENHYESSKFKYSIKSVKKVIWICFHTGWPLYLLPSNAILIKNNGAKQKTTVESLLGEHKNLINLDNLVQVKSSAATGAVPKNPFADQPNPFQV